MSEMTDGRSTTSDQKYHPFVRFIGLIVIAALCYGGYKSLVPTAPTCENLAPDAISAWTKNSMPGAAEILDIAEITQQQAVAPVTLQCRATAILSNGQQNKIAYGLRSDFGKSYVFVAPIF